MSEVMVHLVIETGPDGHETVLLACRTHESAQAEVARLTALEAEEDGEPLSTYLVRRVHLIG